uniref:Hypoxia up-regulated protein 1 n=1 Tax=Glossina brevipalpis TaxID=37001 RepID=A0A1A9WM96_9MUSC
GTRQLNCWQDFFSFHSISIILETLIDVKIAKKLLSKEKIFKKIQKIYLKTRRHLLVTTKMIVNKKRVSTSSWWCSLLVAGSLFVILSSQVYEVKAAAVMSVDLGSEWMKVGVVSPGVPMEIALNRESKRKTPATLAFRDGLRTFGEDALNVGIRDPSSAYSYLIDLLGKTIDNPIVDLYRKRFPYYNIVGDPDRNTVVFKKSDKEQFLVEELVAQILMKAKEFAQDSTHQRITEAVLTVPGYFGQAEREALLAAAQLANIKILQLINDYTAVGLNYGVFHPSGINETAQYYIFYDMGASSTSAAVISYQLVKDKHTKETHPVVQVLGVGYDRTLGGLEIQLRLRDYLADEFNAMRKTSTDVKTSPRALAKLFKEAGRVKNVLSANNDHFAQIENVLEDQDFKLQVSREKLEEICADLWPRVIKPLEQALAHSGLSLNIISQVIILGGSTRIPKVQDTIKQFIKEELGKSLNADEAAAIGAAYKAADLATGFKVKKFVIKDAAVLPIHVAFERETGEGAEIKHVKRVLFGLMNSYPQKKVITFNKHTTDFQFHVCYGDLTHLSSEERLYVGATNISLVELEKIKDLLEKMSNESVEAKGIKAYFAIDDSGIFRCTGVEYVYDKQKIEEDEGTLAKLGNTISKLFSKDTKEEEKKTEDLKEVGEDDKIKEEKSEEKASMEGEDKLNKTTTEKTLEEKESTKKNETVKIVTIKEPVQHKINFQFTPPLTGKAYEQSLKKLNAIDKAETMRSRLESSFNALESHIIDVQQKLEEEEYASCLTSEEKQNILSQCSTISDWLYDDLDKTTHEMYETKLNDLKQMTNVFMARHWEHEERPEALRALDSMIDGAQQFLENAKNLTKDINPERDVFTQIEIDTLTRIIEETLSWKNMETEAQNKLQRHEKVRLTVKDITDHMASLDREVKYMVNKIKIWKPKPKPTTKKEKKADKKIEEAETNETVSSFDYETQSDDDLFSQEPFEEEEIKVNTTEQSTTTPRTEL